jgi:hypothetical protein
MTDTSKEAFGEIQNADNSMSLVMSLYTMAIFVGDPRVRADVTLAADTISALSAERDALKAELHETRMQAIVDFGKLQKACEERDALKAALAALAEIAS